MAVDLLSLTAIAATAFDTPVRVPLAIAGGVGLWIGGPAVLHAQGYRASARAAATAQLLTQLIGGVVATGVMVAILGDDPLARLDEAVLASSIVAGASLIGARIVTYSEAASPRTHDRREVTPLAVPLQGGALVGLATRF